MLQYISCLAQESSLQKFDTLKIQKCQTFDEFSLQGVGVAKKRPYVFVDQRKDTIVVVSSYDKDSIRVYTKLNDNLWYSHMEYDMDKKGASACHCKQCRLARTYDRYFYNDSIVDLQTYYDQWKKNYRAYVRTKKDLHIIHHVDSTINTNISNLKSYIYEQCKMNKGTNLEETDDSYSYAANAIDSYHFEKKAYGLWGTLPGIEETNLYKGIDIREYNDNLMSFQKENPDYIYKYTDELPSFPGGSNAFNSFLKNNTKENLYIEGKGKGGVFLEVVIEKDGTISNPIVIEGIDQLHNEDAISIVRKMPKWIPAKLNEMPIRYRKSIIISYRKRHR